MAQHEHSEAAPHQHLKLHTSFDNFWVLDFSSCIKFDVEMHLYHSDCDHGAITKLFLFKLN